MIETTAQKIGGKKYSRYYTYIEPIVGDPVIAGYFTLIATLILSAFFIVFALSPTFSTIVGLVRKIEDQKKLIISMDSKINSLIVAQENYTQVEEFLPLLDSAIPQKPMPETLITDTLHTASSSGVAITSFRISSINLFGTKPDPAQLQTSDSPALKNDAIKSLAIPVVDFKISITGNQESIRQFSLKLQNLPRIVTLSTLSVSSVDLGTGKVDPNNLSADISGVAYYQYQQNQPALPAVQ